ncbi:MAG: HAD hydrolase family protein, partial [Clostridiaceae bacterium]|nr:HAD hydrolase family protein [Clostridiaceae bacterium]
MHLYLSDLDGTLLQPDATVSDYTRSVLNRLADENIHFSVATARTAATVRHILAGV